VRAEVVRPLALAAVAVAVAFALSARTPPPAADAAAALGGARPLVVGSLFLRAEALRAQGRLDEVPALYRRILELDPTSSSAVDHLAGVLAYDLRTTAPTPAGRVGWWREADVLVAAALERSPDDPLLLTRRADLLLLAPTLDPAVADALAASGRDRELEALRALRRAAAASAGIPRLGRLHLELVVRHAPRVAAERLAGGRGGGDEALEIGDEVLRTRREPLAEIFLDDAPDAPPAAIVLEAGLRLVRRVAADLAASPPRLDDARALVETYAKYVGPADVVEPLRRRLR
jgi:tetratricopeptide (TPR) repeat protein